MNRSSAPDAVRRAGAAHGPGGALGPPAAPLTPELVAGRRREVIDPELGVELDGDLAAWPWGGALNGLAIVLFLASSAHAVVGGRRAWPRSTHPRAAAARRLTPIPRRLDHVPDRPGH